MRVARRASAFLLLLALLSGCSSVQRKHAVVAGETVEAVGWAPVDPKDISGTKNRALADAQKRAIEKVAGVFLAASTKVEAAIAIQQKILTNTQGHIQRYEVLDEKTEAGFLKIRIRALVLRGGTPEGDRIPVKPPLGTPSVEVRISVDDSQVPGLSSAARSALRDRFAKHGFSLVTDSLGGSGHAPFLLVQGETRVVPVKDARLGEFRSFRARVSVRITDSRTGEVVLEKSGEASALDLDSDSAAMSAAANAGALVGNAAADDLTAVLWKRF